MRGVVFLGNRRSEVRDFTRPLPKAGEVVVRVKASGLCGSDLHIYRQPEEKRRAIEIIPGHEPSGVIEELGEGVRGLQVGERVAVYLRISHHPPAGRRGRVFP